jgi:arginyl-tRNA synthetase
MKSPLQETRQLLLEQIVASMGLDTETVERLLVYTKDDAQGDITLETFQLREFYGGMNPAEIADMIASSLMLPDFVSVEHKGPFLNFRLSDVYLAQHALDAVTEQYGYKPVDHSQQPTIVEYSSPNYGKDLHVGHIRSTIVGEAISRLLFASGVHVVRINYPGDVGAHMGKVLTGIDEWHGGILPNDPEKAMTIMRQAYTEYERNVPSGKEGDSLVIDILPDSERQRAYELRAKSATMSLNIEYGEQNTVSLWKQVCDLSRQAHALLYDQLHVAFDYIQPASSATKRGKAIVAEALKKGIAVQHGKEITVDFGQGQFQKLLAEDGVAVYATLDLGIAHLRYDALQFARMIYVVGAEQAPYFEKLFGLEQRLGYPYAAHCEHLATGHLVLSQGKMSSRKGNVTLLKDV